MTSRYLDTLQPSIVKQIQSESGQKQWYSDNPSICSTMYGYLVSINYIAYTITTDGEYSGYNRNGVWSRILLIHLNPSTEYITHTLLPMNPNQIEVQDGRLFVNIISSSSSAASLALYDDNGDQPASTSQRLNDNSLQIRSNEYSEIWVFGHHHNEKFTGMTIDLMSDTMNGMNDEYHSDSESSNQNTHVLEFQGYRDYEWNKNWSPLLFYNHQTHHYEILFVHTWCPLTLLKCNMYTGECRIDYHNKSPYIMKLPHCTMYRGSSTLVALPSTSSWLSSWSWFRSHGNHMYLTCVHERQEKFLYRHRFLILTYIDEKSEWLITHYSDEFTFTDYTIQQSNQSSSYTTKPMQVEFLAGLLIEQRTISPYYGSLIMTYGKDDKHSFMKIVPLDQVLGAMHPITIND